MSFEKISLITNKIELKFNKACQATSRKFQQLVKAIKKKDKIEKTAEKDIKTNPVIVIHTHKVESDTTSGDNELNNEQAFIRAGTINNRPTEANKEQLIAASQPISGDNISNPPSSAIGGSDTTSPFSKRSNSFNDDDKEGSSTTSEEINIDVHNRQDVLPKEHNSLAEPIEDDHSVVDQPFEHMSAAEPIVPLSDSRDGDDYEHKYLSVDNSKEQMEEGASIADNTKEDEDMTEREENEDGSGDTEIFDSELESFDHIINKVNLLDLKRLALRLRNDQLAAAGNQTRVAACGIIAEPQCGTYNLVFTLIFSDGVRWIARLPGYGLDPSELQIEKMTSEYKTMMYVKANTSFKIPETYYWSADPSIIGCAFGLTSFVEGVCAYKLWDDHEYSEDIRLMAITNIATEMAKLYTLAFPNTGMLRFDDHGQFSDVDYEIEYNCANEIPWAKNTINVPHKGYESWIRNELSTFKKRDPHHKYHSAKSLLKLIMKSIPRCLTYAPLSLCPYEPDWQNIYIDPKTGEVTGFIDLDGLHVVPVHIGAAAYPPFLTRDLNMALTIEELDNGAEYNPTKCKQYREHYAEAFANVIKQCDVEYDPRWTLLSHRTTLIQYALYFPDYREEIVYQMLRDAYSIVFPEMTKAECSEAWQGDVMHKRTRRLKQAIKKGLWVVPGILGVQEKENDEDDNQCGEDASETSSIFTASTDERYNVSECSFLSSAYTEEDDNGDQSVDARSEALVDTIYGDGVEAKAEAHALAPKNTLDGQISIPDYRGQTFSDIASQAEIALDTTGGVKSHRQPNNVADESPSKNGVRPSKAKKLTEGVRSLLRMFRLIGSIVKKGSARRSMC